MKALGTLFLLLLGLAYGFEDNKLIGHPINPYDIDIKPNGHLRQSSRRKGLIFGKARMEVVAFNDIESNEFSSTEKVNDEKVDIISKLLRAIKRIKDNELGNIIADDVEEDHFFLFKGKEPYFSGLPHHVSKYAFVDDPLKAIKQQAVRVQKNI